MRVAVGQVVGGSSIQHLALKHSAPEVANDDPILPLTPFLRVSKVFSKEHENASGLIAECRLLSAPL
jgi:hypothetical protein